MQITLFFFTVHCELQPSFRSKYFSTSNIEHLLSALVFLLQLFSLFVE